MITLSTREYLWALVAIAIAVIIAWLLILVAADDGSSAVEAKLGYHLPISAGR